MKFLLCLLVLTVIGNSFAVPGNLSEYSKKQLGVMFRRELSHRLQTKETTSLYQELVEIFKVPKPWKPSQEEIAPRDEFMCVLCTSALGAYMDEIRNGWTYEEVSESILELCMMLDIQTERVCRGAIENNVQEIHYIVLQRPDLTTEDMCGVIFEGDCPMGDMSKFEWSVNVNPNKPPLTGSKDTSVAPSANDLKVVHITDPHYDPSYLVGSWAACNEGNCCRFDQVLPEGSPATERAGRWGDYRDCDSPLDAVIDAFGAIRREHSDIEYVYFTGDIVDHAIWATSMTHNKNAITRIHDLLKSIFSGIPVFPVLGNHEAHPVNVFAPSSVALRFSSQWLYDYFADEWKTWLPESALETVRLGGYYTVLVRPGLRIITINNNECQTMNWWIFYEPAFPRAQLQWLHDTLLLAETNNEKVHLLTHLPPKSCFTIYAREYNRIIERFWNTISAQFGGHTHKDEFNIFYARDNPSQALNVLWNGGSTTSYSDVNPNYRIYKMDQQTYQINAHETWIYNLTLANLNPNQTPNWYKEYNFASEYGISNLSPAALSNLADTLARSPTLLNRYWELKHKLGDTSLELGCDDACLANHLCQIVTTESGNSPRCEELKAVWNGGRK